jgi:hypothetical protein
MTDDAAKAPAGDPFATQKSNIRDTIKWMVAAYSGVAAVLIAGTSLSGLGALPLNRLAIAGIAGFFVLIFVFFALSAILKVLIGDNCFAGDLDLPTKNMIDLHAEDVLPTRFSTYDEFLKERRAARVAVRTAWQLRHPASGPAPTQAEVAQLEKDLADAAAGSKEFETVTRHLVGQAHLFRLQRKLDELRSRLAVLTGLGVIALVVCIWALTPEKHETKPLTINVVGSSSASEPGR